MRKSAGSWWPIPVAAAVVLALAVIGMATSRSTERSVATQDALAPQELAVNPGGQSAEAVNAPEPVGLPEAAMVKLHGVDFQDDPYVRALLDISVSCDGRWGQTGIRASLFDVLRLRTKGYASFPSEYDIRRETTNGHIYVILREHWRRPNGEELTRMPGVVVHRYLYDDARDRFEYLSSTPEDPAFDRALLPAYGDPLGFLATNWIAVCNGRLSFPEVKAELAAVRQRIQEREAAERQEADRRANVDVSRPTPGIKPTAPDTTELEAEWNSSAARCREGAGDDPETAQACKERERIRTQLRRAGMCLDGRTEWRQCG